VVADFVATPGTIETWTISMPMDEPQAKWRENMVRTGVRMVRDNYAELREVKDVGTHNPPANHKMNTTTVEGKQVTIGDVVGFKCDIEQYGKITKIERDRYGIVTLTLEAFGEFDGEYIGGQTETTERANDCWI
jgi:hypothetical protein